MLNDGKLVAVLIGIILKERIRNAFRVDAHLRVLKGAGIVEVRALGQQREYFIATTFRRRGAFHSVRFQSTIPLSLPS